MAWSFKAVYSTLFRSWIPYSSDTIRLRRLMTRRTIAHDGRAG